MIKDKYEATHWYVYDFGRYLNWYNLRRDTKNNRCYMILKNEITGEVIKGLKNINHYLEINNLEARKY